MKSQAHLLLNTIIILPIIYFIYGNSFFQLNMLHLFIGIYLFSNLPDIDNSKSKISRTFILFYLFLAILGLRNILRSILIDKNGSFLLSGFLLGFFQLIIAISFAIFHFAIADNSKKHRKFPHTFTFGLITSVFFGFFSSWEMAIFAFSCFFLHLLFDNHIIQALKNDLKYWKKIFFFLYKFLI